MGNLIVNLAMTGWIPTREMSPYVPLSVEEIVADAVQAVSDGASILHLHAREDNGEPSYDIERYRAIIQGIRAHSTDVVITVTTSGRRTQDFGLRSATLELAGDDRPDMASLTLGSMNFADGTSMNEPATVQRLAAMMLERGIKPELEVFDLGMINYAKVLIDKGLLEPPYYFNLLLGNIATAQADLLHLATMIRELPEKSIFAIGGIGRFQRQANNLGAMIAHGVRTGLEDNLWMDAQRTEPASNIRLLKRVVVLARAAGREIASPAETRQRLAI